MKYEIIKEIGIGGFSTVYKIKIDSKYYALRRQKILKEEAKEYINNFKNNNILENTKKGYYNNAYRTLYFNMLINKINKNHFLLLHSYKISKCNFTQKMIDRCIGGEHITRRDLLLNSKYCLDIITDIKDGSLEDIINILSQNQYYSMIIQILFGLYLMHSNKFYHTDTRISNFCFIKTNIKYLDILGFNIPTFGYIFSIIDYFDIKSITFLSDDINMNKLLSYSDLRYYDNMFFLGESLFYNDKIILNDDGTIFNDPKFDDRKLNYKDTKYYIKHATNEYKLIKYFYKKINM